MTRDDLLALPDLENLPKGQISPMECKMLYGLAKDCWTGAGDIVEIGSLYGKSTVCLARGMRDNAATEKPGRLHAFDKWTADDENAYMLGQLPKGFKGSFRHFFDDNTQEVAQWIDAHEGDVADIEWCGRPIEILFIDCSVSKEFHEMLFRKFFPSLVDGAILIHQDFFLYRSYYLPLMMAKLSPYFDELGNMDTSMMYQQKAPIPPSMYAKPLGESDGEIVLALEVMSSFYGGPKTVWGAIIETMLVYFYTLTGDKRRAEDTAQKIVTEHAMADGSPVAMNLNHALAGC